MDLKVNPFAFLGEEEDTDVLIQKAKAFAATAAASAKETAAEQSEKEGKNQRKNEIFSTRAKRIILPRYVTKRDIIVRKEKPEGDAAENGYGDSKSISTHKPYNNGHANNNRVEDSLSRNKSNANYYNGHHHGVYQGKYRRGFHGSGGRGRNPVFNENNTDGKNQKSKEEQGSNGVEKQEEDGWTRVERRRRRSGSYDYSNERSSNFSSHSETMSENTVENKSSEGSEMQQSISSENGNGVAVAANGENKSNQTEKHQKSNGEKPRTKKNIDDSKYEKSLLEKTEDSQDQKKEGPKPFSNEVRMGELRKKWKLNLKHGGRKPHWSRRGESEKKQPAKGGVHVQNSKDEGEKSPLPPSFEDLHHFPNLSNI